MKIKMLINDKILSIPPYISTSWKFITSLKAENKDSSLLLHITLQDGSSVDIPNMDPILIETVFTSHAKYLEGEFSFLPQHLAKDPFSFFYDSSSLTCSEFQGLTSFLQHDPDQSCAPNFPKELLNRISTITLSLNIKNSDILPKEEPHCNCAHCQIVRSMKSALEQQNTLSSLNIDEEVSEDDLQFRSWIIQQLHDKSYKLTHPDQNEHSYLVNLESPISCTCGSKGCEHVRAVLSS